MTGFADFDLSSLTEIKKKGTFWDIDLSLFENIKPQSPKQAPSEFITPGSWLGSTIPEIKTDTPKAPWLEHEYDLWETSLSTSPTDTGLFWKAKQVYTNLLWNISEKHKAWWESFAKSWDEFKTEAYEWWQDMYQWDIVKWIWKDISAFWTALASPFMAMLNDKVIDIEIPGSTTNISWDTVWKVLGMPFEVLHQDFANWLACGKQLIIKRAVSLIACSSFLMFDSY